MICFLKEACSSSTPYPPPRHCQWGVYVFLEYQCSQVFSGVQCSLTVSLDLGLCYVTFILNLLTVQVLLCVSTYTHASKISDVILVQSL